MKFGLSMWSYVQAWKQGRIDLPGFIQHAKMLGAQGVELLDFFYRDPVADREAAQAALSDAGIPCCVFSVGPNFAKPEAEARKTELAKVLFGIDEAKRYGASVVRVFAGDLSEGIDAKAAHGWIVDSLAEASAIANESGIRLALENHGKLAGQGEQVRKIILDVRDKAGNDALGANPDTGNFLLVGQASHEALAQVAEFAYMAHFKDFKRAAPGYAGQAYTALDGGKFVGAAIGEGDVDLAACVRVLAEKGFDGWLNIEYEAEEDPFTGVPRSVTATQKLLGIVPTPQSSGSAVS